MKKNWQIIYYDRDKNTLGSKTVEDMTYDEVLSNVLYVFMPKNTMSWNIINIKSTTK